MRRAGLWSSLSLCVSGARFFVMQSRPRQGHDLRDAAREPDRRPNGSVTATGLPPSEFISLAFSINASSASRGSGCTRKEQVHGRRQRVTCHSLWSSEADLTDNGLPLAVEHVFRHVLPVRSVTESALSFVPLPYLPDRSATETPRRVVGNDIYGDPAREPTANARHLRRGGSLDMRGQGPERRHRVRRRRRDRGRTSSPPFTLRYFLRFYDVHAIRLTGRPHAENLAPGASRAFPQFGSRRRGDAAALRSTSVVV